MNSPANEPAEVMEAFPAPVPPCASVDDARRQRLKDVTRVTLLGIAVRIGVIFAELVTVILSGSAALFVDMVASLFDVVSSCVLLAAVRYAARPPDDKHPFGHGRAEPLAGFQLGVLLIAAGAGMAFQNGSWMVSGEKVAPIAGWVWVVPGCASLLLAIISFLILRTGKKTESTALKSEAIHFQIDTWTTVLATLTLLAASRMPDISGQLDHFGGLLLAIVMVVMGVMAARENLNQLLDRVPHDAEFERVRLAAMEVDGVIDVEKVRIQQAGPDAHIDIDIEVAPEQSVAESHLIAQHVRASIQTEWPFVREVVVHVEPYYEGDH